MRNVDTNTITDAFMGYMGKDTDPRLRYLLETLARHIHDYAREVKLTHAEWQAAIMFLTRAGEITDAERNEFILTSDVLGLSSLVDMINTAAEATESSVLGPFHIEGAPLLAVGGDLKRDNAGDWVVFNGVVTDGSGKPIAGAQLDIWHTAPNGLYSNQDSGQERFNFRTRMLTGPDGRYLFTTSKPKAYTVPDDGPVGDMLRATGRHSWRPGHMHFIISAPGRKTLVTELFPDDDPYLDEDAVFGVRETLIINYRKCADRADLPDGLAAANRVELPFYRVDFDFTLAAAETAKAA